MNICLGFWEDAVTAGVVPLPPQASVLEIGCAEDDWSTPALVRQPDLRITGIDVRACERPGTTNLQADVLTHDFPANSFDAIVAVSTLEHVGLNSYGDPVDPEGDTKAVQRAWSWLKPGGFLYFDVPYRPEGPYSVNGNFRAYDPAQLAARYPLPDDARVTWKRVFLVSEHADGPYIALVWVKQV